MANVTVKNTAAFDACEKLYLNEEFADVYFVFEFDGDIQKVPANKLKLAVLSPVFKTMFYGSLKEGKEVRIKDADADAFKEFLQFFYLGELTLSMENIEAVVRLADKYDVLEFIKSCAAYFKTKLTTDKMVWGYQLAVNLKSEELIEFCEEKIAEAATKILATDAFKYCDRNILERILELDLRCEEKNIFEAALAWAKQACKDDGSDESNGLNLRNQLGDCLHSIRFSAMSVEDFSTIEMTNDGLFTRDEFRDIMLKLTAKKYEPKIFKQNPRPCKYQWNQNDILICKRQNLDWNQVRSVRGSEIVWFTTNQTLILGKIESVQTTGFQHDYHYINRGDIANVKISEITGDSSTKVWYQAASIAWNHSDRNLQVSLTQPVTIKPNIIYEIRFAMLMGVRTLGYYAKWNPTIELENGLKIQFLKNPSHTDYDTSTFGWIQSLHFNKL